MFKRFTAQLGDKTYEGEWALDGDRVEVRCAYGVKSRTIKQAPRNIVAGLQVAALALGLPFVLPGAKPGAVAERLLIEILTEAGEL